MEQLLELARRLGRQVAQHERTTLLKQAQKAVDEDAEAGKLVKEYHEQAQKVMQLEKDQKPVEVGDKHTLRNLEEKISCNEHLRELTRRQVDFVEMMRKIKESIDGELGMQSS